MTKISDKEQMVKEIRSREDFMLNNFRILRKADPNDHYWQIFINPESLKRDGFLFETGMVINWIGNKFKPKSILEIGTRTGGSLICLLSTYNNFDNLEILCFDLWREYFSTTPLSNFFTKLLTSKKENTGNINISEKKLKPLSGILKWLAVKKVRHNLACFNIPIKPIQFISGDSKITIPKYFEKFPDKKFDYILVDGGHDEHTALVDLENIAEYVNQNGVVVFDDIGPESYKLISVWKKFKENHKNEFNFFEILHRKGVAWAIKK